MEPIQTCLQGLCICVCTSEEKKKKKKKSYMPERHEGTKTTDFLSLIARNLIIPFNMCGLPLPEQSTI